MLLKLSRSVSPFLVLSAVSLAGCKLDVSFDGVDTGTSSATGNDGGGGIGGIGGAGGGGGAGGAGGFVVSSSVSSVVSSSASSGVGGWEPSFTPDKVDLLFVVDNSGSMADKQEVLGLALADLVEGMTNPPCVDPSNPGVSVQPSSGLDACPAGLSRARTPVQDMHIGVISSSLGGHGSNACQPTMPGSHSNDDKAHLLARSHEAVTENDLPTYEDRGFLVWDAAGTRSPAGESDSVELAIKLSTIVQGVGQAGCGFEAPLESFYRFLVDPAPHNEIVLEDGDATPVGLDAELLAQRKAFLRPDSLLVIVMLSDENDCSIRDGGRNYLVAETRNGFRMWRPRSECATNPNDPCCKSCSQNQAGCPADPTCTGPDGNPARLSAAEDPVNLRCWDQKRRFGYDFLYPIQRYRSALTSTTIATREGNLVPNPIFSDLDPTDDNTRIRGPEHVVFTGIVGVPWQDIARNPSDLGAGLKTAAELAEPLAADATTWDVILGDPANHVPPLDPFMRESMAPRTGVNPITGDETVQPDEVGWNAINGREYTIAPGSVGDLQYACIFDIPTERSCDGAASSCDCRANAASPNDSPLCKPEGTADPADPGPRSTTQEKAKAYPGIRELQLIRELGESGVAGSICPAQLSDTSQPDFGYRPVMNAVLDRLSTAL